MSKQITITHERTDDIPVIIAFLLKRRVAELIDKHFPTHGHWTGVSLGHMVVGWWTFIVSEGDPRLSHVEPWVAAHQPTLSRSLGQEVLPRDCPDDRLATGLDSLSVAALWVEDACARKQTRIRVSDLHPNTPRGEPTTVSADVTPDGLCQLGHRKDHRPDLPPLKSALTPLEPLGLPRTIATVAGNTAADPLSLPASAHVRRGIGGTGMTDIGDGKIAALATRADIVAHHDVSLGPLSATQGSAAALARLLAPVWRGEQPLADVRLSAAGHPDDQPEPEAVGLAAVLEPSGQGQAGPARRWQERRWGVRSLAHARRQEESLRQRAQRAVAEINALTARTQGTQRLAAEADALQGAAALIATPRVAAVIHLGVHTTVHEATQRRYGQRPARASRTTRGQVEARIAPAALAQAVRRRGWRVDATKHDQETMGLTQVVAA
jgi:hypothetical protein